MDDIRNWLNPPLVWFLLGLIMLLLEFVSPGVVLVFFGMGAWIVAALALILNIPLNIQLLLFILSSVALLILLREKFQSMFQKQSDTPESESETSGEFIGRRAKVTEKITAQSTGRVEFRGTHWNAEASVSIAKDTPVEIIGKKSITLVVKPLVVKPL